MPQRKIVCLFYAEKASTACGPGPGHPKESWSDGFSRRYHEAFVAEIWGAQAATRNSLNLVVVGKLPTTAGWQPAPPRICRHMEGNGPI